MVTRANIDIYRSLGMSEAVINHIIKLAAGEESIAPFSGLRNGDNGTLQFPPMADPGTAMDVDTLLGNLGGPKVALNLPQPGSQDPTSPPVNVSSDLVLVNGQWQVKDPGAPPPPGGSRDEQILANVMTGAVIDTSQLAEMTDPQMRRLAANKLAKNIVANFVNPDDPFRNAVLNRLLEDIYNQFVADLVDIDFKVWSEWVIGGGEGPEPVSKTAVDPGAVDPGAVDPGAVDPGAVDPGAVDPGAVDPGAADVMGAGAQFPQVIATALQGNDKDIFEFLLGVYRQQIDQGISSPTDKPKSIDTMLIAAADYMSKNPGTFGQNFTDPTAAYVFLEDWVDSPVKGNFQGTGWGTFETAANTLPPPGPTTVDPGMGALTQFVGGAESLRPFGQIYPGFTSLLRGATTSPAVASAYRQAEAPLELQYLARTAMTPWDQWAPSGPTAAETGSDIKTWLQNVNRGDQQLMMGPEYASFLNQLSGALGSELGALPTFGTEQMEEDRYRKLRGLFSDPASQLSAFMNPFYGATSGAPAVRQAMMSQIREAAQRYQYQHPTGSFLPWAIEKNLGGIQSILPSLAPNNPNWSGYTGGVSGGGITSPGEFGYPL